MNKNLPSGWSWIKLGDVCEFYYGKGLTKNKRSEIGEFPVYGSNGIVGFHDEYFVEGPCLIIGRKGAADEVHISKKHCWPIDTTYYIKNDEKYSLNYLYYVLKNLKLDSLDKSTAIPGLNRNDAYKLQIPLPPITDQNKIVNKLEELFSELDKGVENLRKAKGQIKTYRQSVLAAAFTGRLHRDSQDLRINGINESSKSNNLNNPGSDNLPPGWKWVKFIDFCKLQRGYDLPLKNIVKGKYPVITSGGVNGYHSEFRANGPCLTTGRSGGVGNILFLKVEKYWPHNTVLFVKDFCGNHPEFMYYFFKQFDFKSFSASTAVPTLDRKQLYNEPVKVPPFDEQIKIVSEIERRFSVADKLEQTIDEGLKGAEMLKQSILNKAFNGELL